MSVDEVHAEFGKRLKKAREAHGLTLRQAGDRAGVVHTVVFRAERGGAVELGLAARLAAAFGLSLDGMTGRDVCPRCLDTPGPWSLCRACGKAGPET